MADSTTPEDFMFDANEFLQNVTKRREEIREQERIEREQKEKERAKTLRQNARHIIFHLKESLMQRMIEHPDLKFITVIGWHNLYKDNDIVPFEHDGQYQCAISSGWFGSQKLAVLLNEFHVQHPEPWVMQHESEGEDARIKFGIQSTG